MSVQHSFLEEAVWDRNDQRRVDSPRVTFRVKIGELDAEFVDDFGLFYDPEDLVLIDVLQSSFGGIAWETFVFWKNQSRAEIMIIDPMTDEQVGIISVRRGDPLSETVDWTNVVQLVRRG